jgi:protein N-terminal methyltransferase
VPRLDAAASRMLILSILPALSTINPSHRSKAPPLKGPKRSYRALDCGAGIGRVTSTVLLPLFHRIDLVEPVEKFVTEAKRAADAGKDGWKLLAGTDEPKGVRMWVGGLQRFDPRVPGVAVVPGEGLADEGRATLFATVGNTHMDWPETTTAQLEDGYDLVMIQWCIGHLSDAELVAFLQRSQKALRTTAEGVVEGYIMLKENTCRDNAAEGAGTLFDQEDSSITR